MLDHTELMSTPQQQDPQLTGKMQQHWPMTRGRIGRAVGQGKDGCKEGSSSAAKGSHVLSAAGHLIGDATLIDKGKNFAREVENVARRLRTPSAGGQQPCFH